MIFVHAAAPAGCRNMPGFDDGLTSEKIGDYRFGCSVDAMVAKQIYRPADLQGNAGHDLGDGRRATSGVEYYRRVEKKRKHRLSGSNAPTSRTNRGHVGIA